MEVDVAVIGGGPGGYVAAIRAAQLGLKVALIEKDAVGGTCLNRGCIPTKALIRGAELLETARQAEEYGVLATGISLDLQKMMRRKNTVVQRLVGGLQGVLKSNGIQVIKGVGLPTSARQVEITSAEGQKDTVQARAIILAPGAVPATIPVPGVQGTGVIDSTDALNLKEIPKSLLIIGAGVIGVEFATIFSRLGSQVTLVEMLPKLLPGEDEEVTAIVEKSLREQGVTIYTGATVTSIKDDEAGKAIAFTKNGEAQEIQGQLVLMAVGRKPDTEGLGLGALGVATEKGFIKVNEYLETSLPGVYAVGDAVGGPQFAHKAFADGEAAADNIAGQKTVADYKAIPRCVFTIPEIASVGLSEKEAQEAGYEVQVGRFPFIGNGKATILGHTEGLVKIVSDRGSGEILGVHICGPQATELIHEAALAMKMEVLVEDLANAIHGHPTLSEAIKEAALDSQGLAIHIPAKRKG